MATVVSSSRELVPCAQRSFVTSVWNGSNVPCHISGVQWPQLQPSPVPDECNLCADVMPDDTIVQVPCCQQHLHNSCLVRSFTSCGFHCPFCYQCLSDFARSGSFQASAILQGCMIDVDAQPSKRGSNSLVDPTGFTVPSKGYVFFCCPHVGPYPAFEQLQDRRREWSPILASGAWSPQWLCRQC